MSNDIFLGRAEGPQALRLDRANRHGIVAGATGTGKTVTLQIMAEGFAEAGVPVFAADVKGDLSGIAMPGAPNEKLRARAAESARSELLWPVNSVGLPPSGAEGGQVGLRR